MKVVCINNKTMPSNCKNVFMQNKIICLNENAEDTNLSDNS